MTAPEASSDATTEANKPALVMGASGFLGGHITRHLCEAGRQVRVMLRDTSDTRSIGGLSVERFIGDINNTESMQAAIERRRHHLLQRGGHPVVVNRSSTTLSYQCRWSQKRGAHRQADQMISRFVFTSSMVTLARHSGSPANEDAAFDWWHEAPAYVPKAAWKPSNLF